MRFYGTVCYIIIIIIIIMLRDFNKYFFLRLPIVTVIKYNHNRYVYYFVLNTNLYILHNRV